MKLATIEVKPGQVCKDCDKRMGDREVLVESVDDKYAYCIIRGKYLGKNTTRILLRRMRPSSTGFEFVEQL